MKLETWKKYLSECGSTTDETKQFHGIMSDVIKVNSDENYMVLEAEKDCRTCGKQKIFVTINFRKLDIAQITRFWTGALVSLFAFKRIPVDYSTVHNRETGMAFIDNITSIAVSRVSHDTIVSDEP